MRRLVMSRSTATLRAANRPSYTMVVSFKSESSGRTSPERSSDMNGSRPPPSYANTSRKSCAGAGAESGGAVVSRCCAIAGAATRASAKASSVARTRRPRVGSRGRRQRGLHERADRELREQQRAERIAEELLGLRRGARERDVLRHDDARQRRDVGEVLADLVVVAVHLEPVAIGVEQRAGLGGERLDLAERDAADLGLGRDVVDQRRDFVALRHQAAHQLEGGAVLL